MQIITDAPPSPTPVPLPNYTPDPAIVGALSPVIGSMFTAIVVTLGLCLLVAFKPKRH